MMQIDIVTIFPDFFRGPLDYGIIRRAQEAGLVKIVVHDLRAFAHDRHRTVDDRPFGGGEGMVLKPEPIFECIEAMGIVPRRWANSREAECGAAFRPGQVDSIRTWPHELVDLERLVLICGRYEGVDERVGQFLADRELSVGDYVLSGGELGAAVVVDCVTRLIPGAVGNEASTQQESFTSSELQASDGPNSTCASGGLLDYPHYTRPADFRGMAVPEVLASGNHEQIRRWRRSSALEKTLRNRPDLLNNVALSAEDKELLARSTGKQT